MLTEVKRWTPRRKAEVVTAVREGRITRPVAMRTYDLSREELAAWERDWLARGIRGLAVTKRLRIRKIKGNT